MRRPTIRAATELINKLISATPTGSVCVLRPGIYLIDPLIGIKMKPSITLDLSAAIIRAYATNQNTYSLVKMANGSRLINGVLQGERKTHTGTGGEWGHGVRFDSVVGALVHGTQVINCWGDGFYIGSGCADITLTNVSADYNRRQGLSIIGGRNILVDGANITNTGGTDPGAAIDIEPNSPSDVLQNIVIKNITSANNKYGMLLYLNNLPDTADVSVSITNFRDTGSPWSLVASGIKSIPNTDGVMSKRTIDYISWTNTKTAHTYSISILPL